MRTFAPAPARTPAPRRAEPAKRAAAPKAEADGRVPMYGAGHSLAALLPPPAPPADPTRGDASRPEPPVAQRQAEARGGATPRADAPGAGAAAPPAEPPRWWLERPSERSAARRPPNRTGLPDRLKANVEAMSGLSMDDVRVHRNSPKPAQLQALAYARGTEIHLGPGQERHLPHEAWHVVQQKQGRVRPTLMMKGMALNDDAGLEREADRSRFAFGSPPGGSRPNSRVSANIVQKKIEVGKNIFDESNSTVLWAEIRNYIDRKKISVRGRKAKYTQHINDEKVHKFGSLDDYIRFLRVEAPLASESGRRRPNWDEFWSSIATGRFHHRRHIVMSSVMRDAVYAVTDKIKKEIYEKNKNANIDTAPDLEKLKEEFDRLRRIDPLSKEGSSSLEDAEQKLVSRLHNHKLNIFIGKGSWNSVIGALNHAIDTDFWDRKIFESQTLAEVKKAADQFNNYLEKAPNFGHSSEHKEIHDVVSQQIKDIRRQIEDIEEEINRSANNSGALEDIQENLSDKIRMFKEHVYEVIHETENSTKMDSSQASNEKIKKYQNEHIAVFNKHFAEVASSGNLNKLKSAVESFLDKEKMEGQQLPVGMDFFRAVASKDSQKKIRLSKSLVNSKQRKPAGPGANLAEEEAAKDKSDENSTQPEINVTKPKKERKTPKADIDIVKENEKIEQRDKQKKKKEQARK